MRIKQRSNLYIAISALFLASLACQSVQTPDQPASSESTEAPEGEIATLPTTEPSSAEDSSDQTGGIYDGSWTGTNTVDDKEILFTVEGHQITSITLNYTGENADCNYHGAISTGVDTGGFDAVTINGDSFSMVNKPINDELTFAGVFTSESEANGTLVIKSLPDGLCGEYEKKITWTASKGSSADAEATEDTSGTVSQDDSIAILNEFFDAVNAGDVDAAVDMVDDNVMFSFGANGTQFGRDNLKSFLSSSGVAYQISDTESFSVGMAQFEATASDGTSYTFCTVLLQDGKIISLSLQP